MVNIDRIIEKYFINAWAQDTTYRIIRDLYNIDISRAKVRQKFRELRQDKTLNRIRMDNMRFIRSRKISKESRLIGLEVRLGARSVNDPKYKEVKEYSDLKKQEMEELEEMLID